MKNTQKIKPVTSHEIHEILGPVVDEELVIDIIHSGASREDVMQACEWLDDDDYMGAELEKKISAQTRRVYDLLQEREEGVER